MDTWIAIIEAEGSDNSDPTDPSYYNDGDTPSAIPAPALQRAPGRFLRRTMQGLTGNATRLLRSDYLVVKSTSLGLGAAAQKWTYVTNNDGLSPWLRDCALWDDPSEELGNNDWVITGAACHRATQKMVLVMAAPPTFSTTFKCTPIPAGA